MTLNEKYEAIKYLKTIVVKYQKYEFAAWLRDKEKEILNQLSESNLKYDFYSFNESISYSQYLHLIEVISDFESGSGYNHSAGYTDESDIKEYLYKSCINVIREEKLDRLFGDES
jgi:hypothetical protein